MSQIIYKIKIVDEGRARIEVVFLKSVSAYYYKGLYECGYYS